MNPFVTLALCGASVVFFIGYFLFSKRNYFNRFNIEYHVRNTFPYEFNYQGRFKDNLLGNLFLCLFFITSIGNFAMFDLTHTGFMIFVLVMGLFSSIMVLLINFVPLKLLKGHIATSVLTFLAAFITPASIAIASFSIYRSNQNSLALATSIIAIVVTVFVFILIMNPNLTHWAHVEKKTNEDGSVSYVRPKYFVLAFSEWLCVICIVSCQILLVLMTFSMFYKV